jgi:hypothetical protein
VSLGGDIRAFHTGNRCGDTTLMNFLMIIADFLVQNRRFLPGPANEICKKG